MYTSYKSYTQHKTIPWRSSCLVRRILKAAIIFVLQASLISEERINFQIYQGVPKSLKKEYIFKFIRAYHFVSKVVLIIPPPHHLWCAHCLLCCVKWSNKVMKVIIFLFKQHQQRKHSQFFLKSLKLAQFYENAFFLRRLAGS